LNEQAEEKRRVSHGWTRMNVDSFVGWMSRPKRREEFPTDEHGWTRIKKSKLWMSADLSEGKVKKW